MTTTANYAPPAVPDDVEFDSPKGKPFELRVGPGPYIGKLTRVEKAPDNQWGKNVYWYWELYNTVTEDGKLKVIPAQLNEDGSTYEWRQKTTTKFGKNPKSNIIADARKNVEAILKRDMDDDEDPRVVVTECIGKPAFLNLKTVDTDKGLFLNLGMIEPYRKGMEAPIRRFEPEAEAATDDLPFDGGSAPSDDDEAPF